MCAACVMKCSCIRISLCIFRLFWCFSFTMTSGFSWIVERIRICQINQCMQRACALLLWPKHNKWSKQKLNKLHCQQIWLASGMCLPLNVETYANCGTWMRHRRHSHCLCKFIVIQSANWQEFSIKRTIAFISLHWSFSIHSSIHCTAPHFISFSSSCARVIASIILMFTFNNLINGWAQCLVIRLHWWFSVCTEIAWHAHRFVYVRLLLHWSSFYFALHAYIWARRSIYYGLVQLLRPCLFCLCRLFYASFGNVLKWSVAASWQML